MYVHVIISAVAVLSFSILPLSAPCVFAEHIDTQAGRNYYTVPLPDPAQLSEEEREWFTTFQEGTFYVQGWKDITSEILEKVTQESEKEKLRQTLDNLGLRIGYEWSKRNDIRKINTDMLEQWGDTLQDTAEENPDNLPVVIADIQEKVFELVK
ncbi:MAG: hypothetical protein D3904_14420 [Candidatus Electrothrix sp. EH2]|nr:hypothetical protein [Candidatus Electrothrix sp. EH2]